MQHEVNLGELTKIGALRDAIHLAVAPVVANEELYPGQHIGIVNLEQNLVGRTNKNIGIVDPFLSFGVEKGDSFWMILYPQTITSLRHEWSHPEFEDKEDPEMETIIQYFKDIADTCGTTFDELLEIAAAYVRDQSNYEMDNTESYKSVNWSLFWKCYEKYISRKLDKKDLYAPFSCSC